VSEQPKHPGTDASVATPTAFPTRRAVLGAGAVLLLAACTGGQTGSGGTGGSLGTTGATGSPGTTGATPGTPGAAASSGTATAPASQTLAASEASAVGRAPLSSLGSKLKGTLFLPGKAGYEAARLSENPRFDAARPLGVARVASAADVAASLRFARDNGVPLALRSGGHSYAGYSSGGGAGTGLPAALVVDVRALNSVKVSGGSVTVGAGAALAPVYAALAAKGRGIAGGSCATVGVAGLTLGGGVGVLTRAHGLTCDALTSAQIVTADGRVRTVDAARDPELFWALRGGGGGHLGVVTSLTLSTFAAPSIKSFFYQWPVSAAASVIAAWQEWAPTADARLWSTLKVLGGAAHPSGAVVMLSGTWVGAGAPPVAAFLAKVPRPGVSSARTRTYGQAMAGYAGCAAMPVGQCHTGAGGALQREAFAATSHVAYRGLKASEVAVLVEHVRSASSRLKEVGISIDALGGAVGRVAPGATAFVHRKAIATVQYTATYTGNRAAEAAAFVGGFRAAMTPAWGEHAYVNYADPTLKRSSVAYFGANAPRLAAVRRRYDPDGLFTQPQAY
jgi:FAD/FMN-containing dehydrogenase